MGKIRVLSEELVSLISAGEVIENPSSIVKELIENSLDAGTDMIDISIEGGGIDKIVVSDNGIGISKKDQNRIFEKFYRISSGNIHNVKGFGLGLCYVKTIVEEHGGSINIESQTGKGARFILSFPFNTINNG